MRILYVTDALAIWGGLERILVDKANYLAEHYGYQVSIITSEQGSRPVPYALSPKVEHIDLGVNFYQQYSFHGLRRLIKYFCLHLTFRRFLEYEIKRVEPDIIIAMRVDVVSDVIKVKGRIPLVVESHTCCKCYIFENDNFLRRINCMWLNRQASRADVLLSLTEGDANDWRKIANSVVVIPNIVSLNTTDRYSSCESKSVIFVGRLVEQKDILCLLEVWFKVVSIHPDWILHIYGEGKYEAIVRNEVSTMKGNVVLHRPTERIIEKYLESSIFLLTSMYEPFGLVLPEAMSCGLPVVAFDCPYGPADIITDGVDGFLIKDRSVESFVHRVDQLMSSYDLRRRMGQAGIRSSQRYRSEVIMPQWVSLFEQLVLHQSGY